MANEAKITPADPEMGNRMKIIPRLRTSPATPPSPPHSPTNPTMPANAAPDLANPHQESNTNILSYIVMGADYLLGAVLGDHNHDNDRSHFISSIQDN